MSGANRVNNVHGGTRVASFDGTEAAASTGRRLMEHRSSDIFADALSTLRQFAGFAIMAWVYMLAETFVRADEIAARAMARVPRGR
jgi:hypothetical protein